MLAAIFGFKPLSCKPVLATIRTQHLRRVFPPTLLDASAHGFPVGAASQGEGTAAGKDAQKSNRNDIEPWSKVGKKPHFLSTAKQQNISEDKWPQGMWRRQPRDSPRFHWHPVLCLWKPIWVPGFGSLGSSCLGWVVGAWVAPAPGPV